MTVHENGFRGAVAVNGGGSVQGEAQISRQAQEVQAAMTIAKRFPRNELQAISRITTACKRRKLAEAATYSYPRGGQVVTGPSIRLAEVLAQNWGNIDFGIVELEQRDGESDVMAYAWDLETNVRQVKVFSVKHERGTKQGNKKLTDPRDIYETVANNGARRLRACILGVLPSDIVEMAEEACEKTLRDGGGEPLEDRIRKMVLAFKEMGVSQEMIERRLAHKMEATIESELVGLRKIYTGIRDGMTTREQWFEIVAAPSAAAEKAKEMLGDTKPPASPAPETPPAKQADEKASADLMKQILAEANELGHDQPSLDKLAKEFGASRLSTIRQSQAEALLKRLKPEE